MSKISVVTFEYVLKELEKQSGTSIEKMLIAVGSTKECLKNKSHIKSEILSKVFHYCMEQTKDNTLALKIGKSISYHSLGLLGYLLVHTDNVAHMIDTFYHYQKIISGFIKFHLICNEEYYKLCIYINENPQIEVPKFHAQIHLTAIVSILSQVLNKKISPCKTYFSGKKPQDIQLYHDTFGKNVYFKQDENAIFFNKKQLAMGIENPNKQLLAYFELQANSVLNNLEQLSWYAKVKKEILRCIGNHDITLDFVSSRLNVSPRVLQYHLKNENKKFSEALISVRMQLAQHYITKTTMDINSIAFFLGYNEASSFYRAYKKYFKCTPNKNRV